MRTRLRTRLRARLLALPAALALALAPLAGATAQEGPAAAQEEPPAQVAPAPVWEPQMLRLAEVMGALAFLRDLCEAPDAREWPARMQRLIEAEGGARGERLAGAYNRGFRAFALTYRICTPAAERAIAGYLDEGERLTRTVARRFGR